MSFLETEDGIFKWGKFFAIVISVVALMFIYSMFIIPMIKPWWAQQSGKAELAQAEQNRQIAILEAQAKEESAKHLASAEVERAKGVAEANKIIGESLRNNENYLRYLYINGITEGEQDREIIYIPTEAGIPI